MLFDLVSHHINCLSNPIFHENIWVLDSYFLDLAPVAFASHGATQTVGFDLEKGCLGQLKDCTVFDDQGSMRALYSMLPRFDFESLTNCILSRVC